MAEKKLVSLLTRVIDALCLLTYFLEVEMTRADMFAFPIITGELCHFGLY